MTAQITYVVLSYLTIYNIVIIYLKICRFINFYFIRCVPLHNGGREFFLYFPHSCLSYVLHLFILLFHSCCFHARVLGRTLVHAFPFSYSVGEIKFSYLFYSIQSFLVIRPDRNGRRVACQRLTIIIILPYFVAAAG